MGYRSEHEGSGQNEYGKVAGKKSSGLCSYGCPNLSLHEHNQILVRDQLKKPYNKIQIMDELGIRDSCE
jgi:hypothetical protein